MVALWSVGASGEYAWLLWGQDTADKVSIYLSDDGTTITEIKGEHNIAADTWTHIAAVRQGTTVNVYKNGALIKSVCSQVATHVSTSLLLISAPFLYTLTWYPVAQPRCGPCIRTMLCSPLISVTSSTITEDIWIPCAVSDPTTATRTHHSLPTDHRAPFC